MIELSPVDIARALRDARPLARPSALVQAGLDVHANCVTEIADMLARSFPSFDRAAFEATAHGRTAAPSPVPQSSNVYRDALMSQGACNLGGLVHGFARVITTLQAEARERGHGTDWLNRHPACVLFAEQIYHLTGNADPLAYSRALDACNAPINA